MRMPVMVVAAASLGAMAAPSSTPVAALAGRYGHHFTDALMDGTTFPVDDVVEIVPVDPSHAYLRFALNFANGHTCSLAGIAEARGDALVYTEPTSRRTAGEAPCVLSVHRAGAKLGWDDHASCRSHCGARGMLEGDIAWSSRRPITYMARLTASQSYRDALTAWHQDQRAGSAR